MADHGKVVLALRAIQVCDGAGPSAKHELLIEAMDRLGEVLMLRCSGEREGPGLYSHDGGTCPVHEWVFPVDASRAAALEEPDVTGFSLTTDERSLVKRALRLSADRAAEVGGEDGIVESDRLHGLLRRLGGYPDVGP